MVGDNQNTNTGQGSNDVNMGTPVQTNDFNSMQPLTPPPVNNDGFGETVTPAAPTTPMPEVNTMPESVPIPESTPMQEFPSTQDTPPLVDASMPVEAPVAAPFEIPTATETTATEETTVSEDILATTPPSFDLGSTISQQEESTPVETPVEESIPVETELTPQVDSAPANLSEPLPSVAPAAEEVLPASESVDVISTLEEEPKEGKGGTVVVMVLVFIIVALLLTIGYFAYQIFFA